MPLPRFEKLDSPRQQHLLGCAAAEFARKGYAEASLNRIIAQAGVSKGAFYYYFADKADLYATVVARAAEELIDVVGRPAAALSGPAFWAEMERLFVRAMQRLAGEPGFATLARRVFDESGGSEASAPLESLAERGRGWLERELDRGRRLGAIRDDLPVSLLASLVFGLCLQADRWLLAQRSELTSHELRALGRSLFDACHRLCEPIAVGPEPA